jgi:hypothetical protein
MTATTEVRDDGAAVVRAAGRWLLANVHIGPLQPAGPPSR